MADFPLAPYAQQVEIAAAIRAACADGSNVTVSAPTGCGKTLAALVGAVGGAVEHNVRVVYASRTHTQLVNVARELRRAAPKASAVTLGSRDHLCVAPSAKKLSGAERNEHCAILRGDDACDSFANVAALSLARAAAVSDVEDLVREGRALHACPYYASQELAERARVVLVPYNYVFSRDFAALQGAVLVLDEAHNVEDFARDSISFEEPLEVLKRLQGASPLARRAVEADLAKGPMDLRFDHASYRCQLSSARDRETIERLHAALAAAAAHPEAFVITKHEGRFCAWCLDAAVPFARVAKAARSVVLMSGTVPDTLDLGVPFPTRLETAHVADVTTQLCSFVLPSFQKTELDSSYAGSSKPEYLPALVAAVAECCEKIPHGVLVFFSSGKAKDRAAEAARGKLSKPLFVETREFDLAAYRLAAREPAGAVLFAVFRGKLSEGVDFRDEEARGVVIAGMPYPDVNNPRVRALRERKGPAWYEAQAFSALNQAVGRCIRHPQDYGAVVFLESRMAMLRNKAKLSRWIRDAVTVEKTTDRLGAFFAPTKRARTEEA